MHVSKKMAQLSSAIFTELNERKAALMAEGNTIIDFSIGTPDLAPTKEVMDLLAGACQDPANYRYAIRDSVELLEAVQTWYQNRYDVDLATNQITSLLGSQSGFMELALCLIDPGDIVLVPSPSYPIFTIGPLLASAQIHTMPLLKSNDYLIDLDAIDETVAQQAKLMIVSYPNNPTASVADASFYTRLVAFAKKHDIIVLHDNAYSELVLDSAVGASFLHTPGAMDIGVEFNSLSKTYNVPGCRVAFCVGNQTIISQLRALKSHVDYGMFLPLQQVAISLITGPQDQVAVVRDTYKQRAKLLVDGLASIDWHVDMPKGSMFVWAPIPPHYTSSLDFTYDLLYRAHVMVVPGSSFGPEGEGYVRIAMVQDAVHMQQAVTQIAASGILKATQQHIS